MFFYLIISSPCDELFDIPQTINIVNLTKEICQIRLAAAKKLHFCTWWQQTLSWTQLLHLTKPSPWSRHLNQTVEMRLTACRWLKIWISISFHFSLVYHCIFTGFLYASCLWLLQWYQTVIMQHWTDFWRHSVYFFYVFAVQPE